METKASQFRNIMQYLIEKEMEAINDRKNYFIVHRPEFDFKGVGVFTLDESGQLVLKHVARSGYEQDKDGHPIVPLKECERFMAFVKEYFYDEDLKRIKNPLG